MNNDVLWKTWAHDSAITSARVEWTIPIHYDTCNTWTTGGSAQTVTIWREWTANEERRAPPRRYGDLTGRFQVQESEEQKKFRADQEARWRAEDEARRKKYAEEEKLRVEANERAMKLLISCLDEVQRRDLKSSRCFYVEAPSGRLYRIDQGTHGNIKVVDRKTKVWVEKLCIQPGGVPDGDAMLVQKMMIETAEDVFRSHANITLRDGSLIHGSGGLLDATRMAEVIPITRKAA